MSYKFTSTIPLILCVLSLLFAATTFAGTTTYIYDELDRLKEVQFGNGDGIRYEYDEIGNLLSKTPFGNVFTIAASASEGGSISPMGTLTITAGSSKTYTIAPLPGYYVANVMVDGVSQGAITSYPFTNIAANHTIAANFANTYIISASAGSGGSISPGSATVTYGNSQTITITPGVRYQVVDVTVDGVSQGAISSYSFTNVNAPHSLTATFALSSCANQPVRILGKGSYATFQAAYDAAVEGDTIQSHGQEFTESFTANKAIAIIIDGGYDCNFTTNLDTTVIHGAPHISAGTVKLKNIRIAQ
jgi:hypothetical protein